MVVWLHYIQFLQKETDKQSVLNTLFERF